jgi:hypothetical protein
MRPPRTGQGSWFGSTTQVTLSLMTEPSLSVTEALRVWTPGTKTHRGLLAAVGMTNSVSRRSDGAVKNEQPRLAAGMEKC